MYLGLTLFELGLGLFASSCATLPAFGQPPSRASDTCGRADPSYLRVTTETGGQPLFFKPSKAGRIGQFMRELGPSRYASGKRFGPDDHSDQHQWPSHHERRGQAPGRGLDGATLKR